MSETKRILQAIERARLAKLESDRKLDEDYPDRSGVSWIPLDPLPRIEQLISTTIRDTWVREGVQHNSTQETSREVMALWETVEKTER